MPKIRKKLKTFGFTKSISNPTSTNYLVKSGLLSSNEAKNFKLDQLSFSYFSDEIIHSDTQILSPDMFFHDNRTIIFNEKSIAPTIRLESKYISNNSLTQVNFYNENKLLKTPNIPNYHFSTSNVGNNENLNNSRSNHQVVVNTSKIYDKMLKEKHLDTTYKKFIEKTDWNEKLEDKKYNKITIDYNFKKNTLNSDVWLSFSKNGGSSTVNFPDFMFLNTFNGNTAYFYNENYTNNNFGPYDYIGNISSDYKASVNSIVNSPICFNGFRLPYSDDIIAEKVLARNYNSSIIPIQDFGFPYDARYKAQDRHLIKASDYITKPFVLEKVNIECEVSNWSFTKTELVGQSYDYLIPCINFINFFLINQRENINTSSLKSEVIVENDLDGSQQINIDYTSDPVYTLNKTVVRGLNEPYSIDEIEEMESNNINYISTGYNENIDNQKIKDPCQRELITYLTIANYSGSDTGQQNNIFNYEEIKNKVELFIDQSDVDKYDANNHAECIYTNRKVSLSGKIKSANRNTNLPGFTKYNIYPKKSCSTRTNIENSSGRSSPAEKTYKTGNINLYQDSIGKNIKVLENDFTEGTYILHPEDNLVLGVSLSHSFFTNEDLISIEPDSSPVNRFGNDLVRISCSENYPLKLHLIGYYLEDKDKKVIVNKSTKQFKNTKRIGYYQNEVVDQIGSNLGYLEKNFYDYASFGLSKSSIFLGFNTIKNKTRLGNFFPIPNLKARKRIDSQHFDGNIHFLDKNIYNPTSRIKISLGDEYYSVNNAISVYAGKPSVKFIEHYYSKYRFGMFSDKINYNRIYQFEGSRYQNISKKFMKGFYKQKTPGVISAKLKFNFSKMDEFKGTNYLISKIMSSDDLNLKSGADYQLSFTIRDNLSQTVKLVYSNRPVSASAHAPLDYTALYYDPTDSSVFTGIEDSIVSSFVLTNGSYENDGQNSFSTINIAKRKFLQKIVSGINEINSKIQEGITTPENNLRDFKIGVTASIVESTMSTEFPEIKITLDRKGLLNDASITYEDVNSGIIIEDFDLEEGDLLNSYNITSNAYYDDNSIAFKEI